MSKFCGQCGTQLPDEAMVCTNCGTPLAQMPVGNKTNDFKDKASNLLNKVKTDKKLLGIIIGAVALVIALIVVFSLLGGGGGSSSYQAAIDNYVDIMNGDADGIESLCPPEYWDYLEEESNVTVDEIIDDYEDNYDKVQKSLESRLGDNVEFSSEILGKEDISDSDLEEAADNLEEYGISEKDINSGYKLMVELTAKGDDDEQVQTVTIYAIEIDGDWYLLNDDLEPVSF